MSQQDIDSRTTAYVFGELSPEDAAAFERELANSSELQTEVAAIGDAVAALHSEFLAQSSALQPAHQWAVEKAIGDHSSAQRETADVQSAPPSAQQDSPLPGDVLRDPRRFVRLAALAASVMIGVSLAYPYLRRDTQRVSMKMNQSEDSSPTSRASRIAANQTAPDDSADVDQSLPLAFDAAIVAGMRENSTASNARWEEDGLRRQPVVPPSPAAQGGANSPADGEPTDHFLYAEPVAGSSIADSHSGGMGGGGAATGIGASGVEAKPPRRSRRRSGDLMEMEEDMMGEMDTGQTSESMDMMFGMEMGGMRMQGAEADMKMGIDFDLETAETVELSEDLEMSGAATGGMMGMDMTVGDADDFGIRLESANEVTDFYTLEGRRPKLSAAGDRYARIDDNPFVRVSDSTLSTFSIDVDTAAYAKVRMMLNQNALPRPDAVRIEEMLNYFDYDYPAPQDEHPFAASMDIAQCPWNPDHRLARIGIKGKVIDEDRPSSNLVFLLDVSGSMDEPNKLPLVIDGMKMLTDQLTENDKVAIVVYAGAAGLVLDATHGDKKKLIDDALDRLHAGGSTNGGHGILLAYEVARDNFIVGGTNRVILCSDGDFNVGVTGTDQLVRIAEQNAKSDIFLTVLGFGTGNHNDAMMEQISNKGNGNYAFIDSSSEAEKVLVREMGGTLVTIAKDVKIQVEFNPREVASYRLIGYENRKLAAQDFDDDTKDAGEIGAGHTVTALYEIIPAQSAANPEKEAKDLRYQRRNQLSDQAFSGEMLVLKLRYKQPTGDESTLIKIPVRDSGKPFSQTDRDFQFAASVAAFGMLLRDSPHKGNSTLSSVVRMAQNGATGDDFGYRQEFVELVNKAIELSQP